MNFNPISPVRFGSHEQIKRTSSPVPSLRKATAPTDSVHFGRMLRPQPPVDLPSPPDNPNTLQEQHVYRLRRSHDPDALPNQIEILGNNPRSTVYSISDDPVAGGRRAMQTYFLYLDGTQVGEIYREHNGPWSAYKLNHSDAATPLIPQLLAHGA